MTMDRSDVSIDLLRCTQELFAVSNPDDIFLTLQRSTAAVFKIYNKYFAIPKNDFITGLSDLCCIAELRCSGYVVCYSEEEVEC